MIAILDLGPNELLCLSALQAHSVEFLVVGGHAVRAYGSSRSTKDLDVLVSNTPENAARLISALRSLGIAHPSLRPEEIAGRKRQINFEDWGFHFEVITAADGIDFVAAFRARAEAHVGGLLVPVVSRKDLITMKGNAGRPIDLEDLLFLESPSSTLLSRDA